MKKCWQNQYVKHWICNAKNVAKKFHETCLPKNCSMDSKVVKNNAKENRSTICFLKSRKPR